MSESSDWLIDLLLEDQTLDVSRADFQSTSAAALDAALLALLALKQHPIGRSSFATLAKPLRIPSDFLEGGQQYQHFFRRNRAEQADVCSTTTRAVEIDLNLSLARSECEQAVTRSDGDVLLAVDLVGHRAGDDFSTEIFLPKKRACAGIEHLKIAFPPADEQ
jgi:hypothetical protein